MRNAVKSRNLLIISASVQILKRDFRFFKSFKLLIASSATRFCPFFPINNFWIENRYFCDGELHTYYLTYIRVRARAQAIRAHAFFRNFCRFRDAALRISKLGLKC